MYKCGLMDVLRDLKIDSLAANLSQWPAAVLQKKIVSENDREICKTVDTNFKLQKGQLFVVFVK